jgi:glycosyltransferase involved in cell wall biosynthesis
MKITFILPGAATLPIGGFKMVYLYADHLTGSGHDVTVVHTARVDDDIPRSKILLRHAFHAIRKIDRRWRPDSWYPDPLAQLAWVPHLAAEHVPDADIVVATEWRTAKHVAGYDSIKGVPFYFIQHWENWNGSDARVAETWRLPLRKIVIARWLQEIAENMGESAEYIPNSVDTSNFHLDYPINARNPKSLLMAYNPLPSKGAKDGFTVIRRVLSIHPNADITIFGTHQRPVNLPEQVHYIRNPTQQLLRNLYNNAAIFLTTSLSEGWGLPASEAMMCGAMVVGTDVGGHRDFMLNGETALLAPPGDVDRLTEQVLRSMDSRLLHDRIARNGSKSIGAFSMEKSADAMETLFHNSLDEKLKTKDAL